MASDLGSFLNDALSSPVSTWSKEHVERLSRITPPDRTFRWSGRVIKGDILVQWAEWLLGTFCDVDGFASREASYPAIYEEVRANVLATWTEMSPHEQAQLARDVAKLAFAESKRRAAVRRRDPLDDRVVERLLDKANGDPHCWICGWRFGKEAVGHFLGSTVVFKLPLLVDVYKPIGLNERHLHIEVDHVLPHALGGTNTEDNLRLCCGWCNTHKSDRASIYEVAGDPRRPGGLGGALRQPFWVIRLLAIESGPLSAKSEELTVALINPMGGMSPANLKVVSYANDPLGSGRFQGRDKVRKLWKGTTGAI